MEVQYQRMFLSGIVEVFSSVYILFEFFWYFTLKECTNTSIMLTEESLFRDFMVDHGQQDKDLCCSEKWRDSDWAFTCELLKVFEFDWNLYVKLPFQVCSKRWFKTSCWLEDRVHLWWIGQIKNNNWCCKCKQHPVLLRCLARDGYDLLELRRKRTVGGEV